MIGKGAMANVYKARQLSLDRIVAIKVLPKRLSENQDFVSRFYAEGRAAARLSHNNIVQAIDVASTPDGFHYFVMEFIEGKTLFDLMAPRRSATGLLSPKPRRWTWRSRWPMRSVTPTSVASFIAT